MRRRIELLAPGGDTDSIKAAIVAGADAVYCGLGKLNARTRAANLTFDELYGIIALAHRHDCQVFLTLNTMLVESDLPVLFGILNKLVNTDIDGVIVQDPGAFHLLATCFAGIPVHASTQATTHNAGQLRCLARLGATRVNLSRELSVSEVRQLAVAAHAEGLEVEVFVHGSYCLSFSGICYLSSAGGGRSGNRGRCSQPCRDRYVRTGVGKDYPLNMKDNSAYRHLRLLAEAGVDALKIEGRMKKAHYVYAVVAAWREQLRRLDDGEPLEDDSPALHKVFNRGFSDGYLVGELGPNMFCDTPRNQSAQYLRDSARAHGGTAASPAAPDPCGEIDALVAEVRERIEGIRLAKPALHLCVSGASGSPLEVSVVTPGQVRLIRSEACLAPRRAGSTGPEIADRLAPERLRSLREAGYDLVSVDLEGLATDLFLASRELKLVERRILRALNGGRPWSEAVSVPALPAPPAPVPNPRLAVLVASRTDPWLSARPDVDLHYELPAAVRAQYAPLRALLCEDRSVIPWFPAVLLGDDYDAALELLGSVRPERLVTDNSGIGLAAAELGLSWIAGPGLNVANSFSLVALQERLGCSGAFASSELSKAQLRRLQPPPGFELHYRLYHPMELLTTRQCLVAQVTGCPKPGVDGTCLASCEREARIERLGGEPLFVHKRKGCYSTICNATSFLNTDVVADLPGLFTGYLVDLRALPSSTRIEGTREDVVGLFRALLRGEPGSAEELRRVIQPTNDLLYRKGV